MDNITKQKSIFIVALAFLWLANSALCQIAQKLTLPDSATLSNAYKVPPSAQDTAVGPAVNNSSANQRILAAPANDNFANAQALTVGTWLTTGTTRNGTLQGSENVDCNTGYPTPASIWYKFTATATDMYVGVNLQSGANYVGAAVWNTATLPTGNCPAIQCQSANDGPQYFIMEINPATIGQTYYVQIVCPVANNTNTIDVIATTTLAQPTPYAGAPAPDFTNPMPASPYSTCATAYSACYLNYCNPTVAQVTSNCPSQTVSLDGNDVYTACYTFTNGNSNAQIAVQQIISSTCVGGNVYWLDWRVFSSTCALIACGNLNNLEVIGAGCNTTYTVCQTYELAACNATKIWPYACWYTCSPVPCTPLPIQLASFSVEYQQTSNSVDVYWATATETNNREFYVQRSINGTDFQTIDSATGAGNSSQMHYYTATDESPYPGISYYRLEQVDFDGHIYLSTPVPMNIPADYSAHVFPNPTNADMTLRYSSQSINPVTVTITDLSGKPVLAYSINKVEQGVNNFNVPMSHLAPGMYIMKVSTYQKNFYFKVVKQ